MILFASKKSRFNFSFRTMARVFSCTRRRFSAWSSSLLRLDADRRCSPWESNLVSSKFGLSVSGVFSSISPTGPTSFGSEEVGGRLLWLLKPPPNLWLLSHQRDYIAMWTYGVKSLGLPPCLRQRRVSGSLRLGRGGDTRAESQCAQRAYILPGKFWQFCILAQ